MNVKEITCAYHNWLGGEVVTTEFETGGEEVAQEIGSTERKEIPKPIAVKVEVVTVLRCLWRLMGKANSNKMLYKGYSTGKLWVTLQWSSKNIHWKHYILYGISGQTHSIIIITYILKWWERGNFPQQKKIYLRESSERKCLSNGSTLNANDYYALAKIYEGTFILALDLLANNYYDYDFRRWFINNELASRIFEFTVQVWVKHFVQNSYSKVFIANMPCVIILTRRAY